MDVFAFRTPRLVFFRLTENYFSKNILKGSSRILFIFF
jgi:hypothetical protein